MVGEKVLGGQGVHTPCPGRAAYPPAAQGLQNEDPLLEKKPWAQGTHWEAPAEAPKVPPGQGWQAAVEEAPTPLEKVPTPHGVQGLPSTLYAPATHATHKARVSAPPTTEWDPVGHALQAVAPGVSLYCPGLHFAQDRGEEAPGSLLAVPAGQGRQGAPE